MSGVFRVVAATWYTFWLKIFDGHRSKWMCLPAGELLSESERVTFGSLRQSEDCTTLSSGVKTNEFFNARDRNGTRRHRTRCGCAGVVSKDAHCVLRIAPITEVAPH